MTISLKTGFRIKVEVFILSKSTKKTQARGFPVPGNFY
jgi:hypothetical protein